MKDFRITNIRSNLVIKDEIQQIVKNKRVSNDTQISSLIVECS